MRNAKRWTLQPPRWVRGETGRSLLLGLGSRQNNVEQTYKQERVAGCSPTLHMGDSSGSQSSEISCSSADTMSRSPCFSEPDPFASLSLASVQKLYGVAG